MKKIGQGTMRQTIHSRKHEQGAVSLFVVIFCALLMTVLTISFIRIMIQEQQQAATNDLSQSAYDSALAGVEDAKRALLLCESSLAAGDAALCDKLDTQTCESVPETLATSGVVSTDPVTGNKEVKVQTSVTGSDEALNQAYTCVKVTRKTNDYTSTLDASAGEGSSKIIPLRAPEGEDFDAIELSWFAYRDFASAGLANHNIALPPTGEPVEFTPVSTNSWAKNRPPVLRAQLMQFTDNFTLSQFDTTTGSGESNANTIFLYPHERVESSSLKFTDDRRREQDVATGKLGVVTCASSVSTLPYACKIRIELPRPVGGDATNRLAYLRLSTMYNSTSYSVKLLKGVDVVQFDGVLPVVDSTGRANDIFRRVSSRVEMNPINFPYPDAAVDITGSLCKNFTVTDGAGPNGGYASTSCTP